MRKLVLADEHKAANDKFLSYEGIPEWAISYLMYGDESGLSEEDKKEVDDWMEKEELGMLVSVDSEEGYFMHRPQFGLGSTCYDCTFTYIGDADI